MDHLSSGRRRHRDIVAAIGLGVGAAFGLAGTLVEQAPVRQTFWAIDGVGLIGASALLTAKFLRKGHDCVAAGFLVFAIGEGLLLSGTAAGLAGSVPSFGGGVALWAAGLLLTSIPREFANWVRLVGVAAAGLFAIVATRIFLSWFSVNWSPSHARNEPAVVRSRACSRWAARRARATSSLRSRSAQI